MQRVRLVRATPQASATLASDKVVMALAHRCRVQIVAQTEATSRFFRSCSVASARFVPGVFVADYMRSEKINPRLVLADLRIPEGINLGCVLSRATHSPAVDLERSVSELQRGELHAHALKFGYKCFHLKLGHGAPSLFIPYRPTSK